VVEEARFLLGQNDDSSSSVCETFEQRPSPLIHHWRSVSGAPPAV
jgi:hypothetical protein